jgi:hypothetical protein
MPVLVPHFYCPLRSLKSCGEVEVTLLSLLVQYFILYLKADFIARILGPFWREKIGGFCRKFAPPYFNVHEFTMLVGLWSYFPTNPRLSNWLWMQAGNKGSPRLSKRYLDNSGSKHIPFASIQGGCTICILWIHVCSTYMFSTHSTIVSDPLLLWYC